MMTVLIFLHTVPGRVLCLLAVLCWIPLAVAAQVASPDGKCHFHFDLQRGRPLGTVRVEGVTVLQQIPLGAQLVGDSPDLTQDLMVKETQVAAPSSSSSSSAPYNEMSVQLFQRTTAREYVIRVRVSNEDVTLCYEFPEQNTLPRLKLRMGENLVELRAPAATPWQKIYQGNVIKDEPKNFWKRIRNWFARIKNK